MNATKMGEGCNIRAESILNTCVCELRTATEADLEAINDIYNYYVERSTCTYQEEPDSLETRRSWFARHDRSFPATVACLGGKVVGWGSLSPYHVRSAYRHTVENSVYVHHEFHQRGVGSSLLGELIERARELEYRAIIAGIDAEQAGSIALHSRFGFKQVGHFEQVGFKFGKWLDVIYMELLLGCCHDSHLQ